MNERKNMGTGKKKAVSDPAKYMSFGGTYLTVYCPGRQTGAVAAYSSYAVTWE